MSRFTGMLECVIQEETHIRQKIIKVTIPSLFPEVQNKFESTTNTKPINPNRHIGGSPNSTGSLQLTTTTTIPARNFTDYHERLRGNVMKGRMKYTDGITEPEVLVEGAYTDFKSHTHTIKKPITLYDFVYEKLNNVKVAKGTKAYGFFLNGTYDINSFVITRIDGAVPLQADDLINYLDPDQEG